MVQTPLAKFQLYFTALSSTLRLGVRALGKLLGRLAQGSKRNSEPLRQKAQVRIAAERSLMPNLAQEIAHAGMVLEVPRG